MGSERGAVSSGTRSCVNQSSRFRLKGVPEATTRGRGHHERLAGNRPLGYPRDPCRHLPTSLKCCVLGKPCTQTEGYGAPSASEPEARLTRDSERGVCLSTASWWWKEAKNKGVLRPCQELRGNVTACRAGWTGMQET